MYHPDLGWIQRDPLGYVDGMCMYEYVMGRPLASKDPLGLDIWIEGNGDHEWTPGHQSLCIGDRDNDPYYYSASFAIAPTSHFGLLDPNCIGEAYRDYFLHGPVQSQVIRTTAEEDKWLITILSTEVGDPNTNPPTVGRQQFYYLTVYNCRTWSLEQYDRLRGLLRDRRYEEYLNSAENRRGVLELIQPKPFEFPQNCIFLCPDGSKWHMEGACSILEGPPLIIELPVNFVKSK